MEYVNPRGVDFKLSRIVFGAWAAGGWYWGGTDDIKTEEAVFTALDQGITAFDTAPVYGFGHSEEVLGKILLNRKDAIILTKFGLRFYEEKGDGKYFFSADERGRTLNVYRNLRKESILTECEASLRRLRRECIDIYQLHWPDSTVPIEEAAEALNLLYDQGKIKSAGVCNSGIEKIIELKKNLKVPLVADQEKFNLIQRKALLGNVPYDIKNKITFLSYSPLAQGLLTGEVDENRKFNEGDYRQKSDLMDKVYRIRVKESLEKIDEIRQELNVTFASLALAWNLNKTGKNSCVIAGIRNKKQALENSRACLTLTEKQSDQIEFSFSAVNYRGKW